jgi:hypothetical protein
MTQIFADVMLSEAKHLSVFRFHPVIPVNPVY